MKVLSLNKLAIRCAPEIQKYSFMFSTENKTMRIGKISISSSSLSVANVFLRTLFGALIIMEIVSDCTREKDLKAIFTKLIDEGIAIGKRNDIRMKDNQKAVG